jgi:signal peptidase I
MTATQASPAVTSECCATKGILAFFASFSLPGLGQLFAGRPVRAAVFFVLWAASLVLAPVSFACPDVLPLALVFLLLAVVLMVWAGFDAAKVSRKGKFIADGKAMPLALGCLLASVLVLVWVILDWKSSGTDQSFFSTMGGVYGMVVVGAALLVALLALAPSATPATRVCLGALIALLMVWPLDKAAQHTFIYMIHNVVKPVAVRGNSMFPNFNNREVVLVHMRAPIRRFDAVAFNAPGANGDWPDIKRVVGLPGETVEFIEGSLFINGKECPCPPNFGTVKTGARANGAPGNPMTLRDDEYYVLGDNRDESYDSRYALPFDDKRYTFTDKLVAVRNDDYIQAHPGPMVAHQPGAIPAEAMIGRVTWQVSSPMPWRK